MRVATLNTSQTAFAGIEARQGEQARLQSQLSSGQRVNSPGDDPLAAAQAELTRSRLARVAQDQRTGQLATSLLSAADGALGHGVELLQSVREALVAAGDGAYSLSDRQTLAMQLRSVRDNMATLANTRDGAGGFIFAGRGSAAAPMSSGSTPSYLGQPGVQRIGGAGEFAASVDGRAGFIALPQGNGVFVTSSGSANTGSGWIDPGSVSNPAQLTGHNYAIAVGGATGSLTYTVTDVTAGTTVATGVPLVAGGTIAVAGQSVSISGTPAVGDTFQLAPAGQQSIFKTLDDAIAALEQPSTPSAYAEKLERSQASLDRALDSMILMRSRIGEEMRNVDDAVASGQQEEVVTRKRQSDLVDLDFARGISQMQANQIGLEAAIKSYASVAKTSLFELLG